ncbi:transporter substrate-binding domain-containing protein [bacterium]|nr:transporter substrate-binding domain-containing protein [bacterium]
MKSIDSIPQKYLRNCAIIFVFFAVSGLCQTALSKPLVIGTIWFPPFYNIEKEGDKVTRISGINVNIVTKVLDSIGEEYVLKYYPAKRLYANMVKGTTHIFYGIRVPPNVVSPDYILHSKNTISKITLRVFHLTSTPGISKKEDLVGKSIIVFRGYGYGGFINYVNDPNNAMSVHTADSQVNGFKMLKKGRANYLLAFERPALETLKIFPEDFLIDVTYSDPLYIADGYFVISRKTPNAQSLLDRMEGAYMKLENEGVFEGMIAE